MASQSIQKLIESLDNDLPRSALLQKKVPALSEAFDAGADEDNFTGDAPGSGRTVGIPLSNVFLEKRFTCWTISLICNSN